MLDAEILLALGIALIIIGVLIVLLLIFLLSVSSAKNGRVKGAGPIIIGPVPIIFGTNKESLKKVLMLSLALTILLVIAMIVYYLLLG